MIVSRRTIREEFGRIAYALIRRRPLDPREISFLIVGGIKRVTPSLIARPAQVPGLIIQPGEER